jgi:starvation-inducible DNA-binding protein
MLSDTQVLLNKTQVVHWNVEGPRFLGIHKLTEEHYENIFDAIDSIAERVRSLGFYAPSSISTLVQNSQIDEFSNPSTKDSDMLEALIEDHSKMISFIKDSIEVAEKESDSTTADLLSERRDFHEEARWMLQSMSK